MAALSNLIPLLILFVFVGGGAFIGYQIYLWSNEVADRGKKHMEKKNMSFTKEGGLKVGVKELKGEAYEDKTQNVLVNVWNNASFPNYHSKLGWNAQADKNSSSGSSTPRQSTSRTNSSQQPPSKASGAATNLSPPSSRSSQQRPASPVPGAFS